MDKEYEKLCAEVFGLTARVTELEACIKEELNHLKTLNCPSFINVPEQYLGRNLIIVTQNERERIRALKLIKKLAGHEIKYIDDDYIEKFAGDLENLKFADFTSAISSLDHDDYFIFNSDMFLYENKDLECSFSEVIETSEISIKPSNARNELEVEGEYDDFETNPERIIKVRVPKLNYIIFTENINLIPDKLREIMEIAQA